MFSSLSGAKSVNATSRLREGLKLSPNEERYILAETMTGQIYAAPSGARLLGPLDVNRLTASIQATCDRHEARRTGFERDPSGQFTKYVEARATVHLERRRMVGASVEEAQAAVDAYVFQPGDYTPGTLHRYMLIELGEDDHVFAFTFHHATSDGVTFSAFMAELGMRMAGADITTPAPQYGDYWDWDWASSDDYRAAERYWIDHLGGLDDVGVWPADLRGSPSRSRPGVVLLLPPEIVATTRRAAEEIGVTHFSFFYAVYVVLLARLTGAKTVLTTFQSAGRRGKPGAQGAHGVFSNALILGAKVDEDESIAELAERLRKDVREAIANEIVPYHHVIRRTGVHPRYAINWAPEVAEIKVGELKYVPLVAQNQDDDDLNLRFSTHADQARLTLFYDPAAFSRARVEAVSQQLAALATELANDVRRPIGEAVALAIGPKTADQDAPLPVGDEGLIQNRFLDQAQNRPMATAVIQGRRTLTYGELEHRSRLLANQLAAAGVRPGDRVAILAGRCPELVCSILAAARLGAVFVVLDSAYPEARLAACLEIADACKILHTGGAELEAMAARLAAGRRCQVLSAQSTVEPAVAAIAVLDKASSIDPAYVLFTSGTTGGPKGVACSHGPLTHFVDWQVQTYGLGADDRFTMLSGLSHDPLLRDIFTPLSIGAAILVPEAMAIGEPAALVSWLRSSRATVTHLTPALGQVLAGGARRARPLSDLRRVFWGGDLLRPQTVRDLARLAPNASHTNFYGSTETPQAAGFFEVDVEADLASTPIGGGVPGFQLMVVDAERKPVGVGQMGEIAVRSNLLSLGYVRQGQIVVDTDRTGGEGAPGIYYTGDRGLFLPDGAIMIAGRADDQIKVHGSRVELAEVTTALLAHSDVRAAIALAVGDPSDRRIVAFVVGRRRSGPHLPELRSHLGGRLPVYMLPLDIRILEELPRTPNGKVDRQALMALAAAPSEIRAALGVGTTTEKALMASWAEVLGPLPISRASSFASLGGDSLSYVQVYLATEEILGEAPRGWQQMSISELAATARASSGSWSIIDMPIAIRALAIFLVVAGHFQFFQHGAGATSALMIISGFMFGAMPLQDAFANQSPRPVLRTLRNIFLPTAALSLLIWVFRSYGEPPEPYILLMTADLQSYVGGQNTQDLYLWYIHCLLHIFMILAVALLILKAVGGFKMGQQRFLLGLFAAACLGRFVLPIFIDPLFIRGEALQLGPAFALPTTHLPTVLLGALIAISTDRREQQRLLVVLVVYAVATAWFYGLSQAAYIMACGGLLLVVPRLSLPRPASAVVFAVAGASLWIYLSHMLVRDILSRLGIDGGTALSVGLAMVGGVLLWMGWNKAVGSFRRRTHRAPTFQTDATF